MLFFNNLVLEPSKIHDFSVVAPILMFLIKILVETTYPAFTINSHDFYVFMFVLLYFYIPWHRAVLLTSFV
jgi:hypothetical protein